MCFAEDVDEPLHRQPLEKTFYTQVRSNQEISGSAAVHLILTVPGGPQFADDFQTCVILLASAAVVNHGDVRD